MIISKDKLNSNSVSLAGEFAVLSQLALRGFDANMTLGHTKGVDILASNSRTGKMFKIEVKTSYDRKPSRSKLFGYTLSWIMAQKHENVIDKELYFCFVNIERTSNSFRFFIVPNDVVSEYVERQHNFWQERDGGTHPHIETKMRNFRIGLSWEQSEYTINTPLSSKYENSWELLT